MRTLNAEQIREYTKAAYYYYKAHFSQEQIAQKMGMSRQRVNRILSECVQEGLVRISISSLENNYGELEAELEEKYSMERVTIVENFIEQNLIQDLGEGAARRLEALIQNGDVIGISRGKSTLALAENLPQLPLEGVTVTQLIGSENRAGDQIAVDDIVYRLAEKLRAAPVMLYAPVIVQNEALKKSIMQEPFFKDAYRVIASCRIALVGIDHDTTRILSHLKPLSGSAQTLHDVAGETCTHFFDKDGNPVIPPFRENIVSILLDDYKKIPVRLGIAGNVKKAAAIKAAMKGGYINQLVTDAKTAEQIAHG